MAPPLAMAHEAPVDKENVHPRGAGSLVKASKAMLGPARASAATTGQPQGQPQEQHAAAAEAAASVAREDGRESIARVALRKGASSAEQDALFEFDARQLAHLAPPQATRAQMALLEQDSAALGNASFHKLRLWLGLAGYMERRSVGSCARQVFARMVELGIARYYKDFYEAWAAFELRSGGADSVPRILQLAVDNLVVEEADRKATLEQWTSSQQASAAADADETIAFAARASSKLRDEPTVVLGGPAPSVAKKKPTGALRMPTGVKRGKLGRAQRVVVASDAAESGGEGDVSGAASPPGEASGEGGKKKIIDKIGDVSYITNWSPSAARRSTSSSGSGVSRASSSSSLSPCDAEEDMPTATMRVMPDGSVCAPREADAAPTISFNKNSCNAASTSSSQAKSHRAGRSHGGGGSVAAGATPSVGTAAERRTETLGHDQTSGTDLTWHTAQLGAQGAKRHSGAAELQAFHQSLNNPKSVLMVNDRPYLRLGLIGRGGSSKVFKVLAIGEEEPEIYALKRIKLQKTDPSSIASYVNEIKLLERLRGNPNIIRLVDAEVNMDKKVIFMVMELGEVDLSSLLQQQQRKERVQGTGSAWEAASRTVGNLSVNFVRLIWMNMLEAVHAIHEERIVHGDLKPANFMFVKGKLKLIDFGIAKAISNDTTNIMRDTQVGTLNYMSPESIIDINSAAGARPKIGAPGMKLKQGRASDIWSMGCILYQMIYGRTPFHELKLIQKIHCISDPKHEIAFPDLGPLNAALVDAAQECLRFRAADRPPIVSTASQRGLLAHPFLNPGAGSSDAGAAPRRTDVKRVVDKVLTCARELQELRRSKPAAYERAIDKLVSDLDAPCISSPGGSIETIPEGADEVDTTEEHPPVARQGGGVAAQAAAQAAARAAQGSARGSNEAAAPKPAPAGPLPSGLKQSILAGKAGLQPLRESSSARFMRPKGSTPEKAKGIGCLLREGLDKKRELLESQDHTMEAMERSGHTWDFLGR